MVRRLGGGAMVAALVLQGLACSSSPGGTSSGSSASSTTGFSGGNNGNTSAGTTSSSGSASSSSTSAASSSSSTSSGSASSTTGSSSSTTSSAGSSSSTTSTTTGSSGSSGSLAICAPCSGDGECASGYCNQSQGAGFCDTSNFCTPSECAPYGCDAQNGVCQCHGGSSGSSSSSSSSSGSTGSGSSSGATGGACQPNTGPCGNDGDCCGGHCDTAFGTCACQAAGTYCDASSPCCATLTCGRANAFATYDTCLPSCVIDGQTYVQGALNPNNPCLDCDVATSQTSWSDYNDDGNGEYPICAGSGATASRCYQGVCSANICTTSSGTAPFVPEGAACSGALGGSGPLCVAGPSDCATGCYIAGQFYYDGDYNADSCSRCIAASSTTDWDPEPNGQNCDGGVCVYGKCAPNGCVINGSHYSVGEVNPADSCGICRPDIDPNNWVPQWANQGESCTAGSLSGSCYDATCYGPCTIDGGALAAFQTPSGSGCLGCNPLVSMTALSQIPDGMFCNDPADSSMWGVCHAGVCFAN